jgi:hypothetical protein
MEFLGLNTKGVQEQMIVPLSDEKSILVIEESIYTFYLPYAFTIEDLYLSVNTAALDANITVDINVEGASIFSNLLTIDGGDYHSKDATTAYSILTNKANIGQHKKISIDLDAVGLTGTEGKGLKLIIAGRRSTTLDL